RLRTPARGAKSHRRLQLVPGPGPAGRPAPCGGASRTGNQLSAPQGRHASAGRPAPDPEAGSRPVPGPVVGVGSGVQQRGLAAGDGPGQRTRPGPGPSPGPESGRVNTWGGDVSQYAGRGLLPVGPVREGDGEPGTQFTPEPGRGRGV